VFDAAVHQGVAAAIRMLQAALGVNVDGVIGTKTISEANAQQLIVLVSEVVAQRMVQYGRNPKFSMYGLGWSRRLARAHQAALGENYRAQLGGLSN
jgi:lysozyme family protein